MRDIELYQQILGLKSPWKVERVELSIADKRVDIHLTHKSEANWSCPTCGKTMPLYDHSAERSWRHLDTCQVQTLLHASVPRVECTEHGVGQVSVPWALPHGRFTAMFEALIIDVLHETGTVTGAVNLLGITWDEGWGVMDRAVKRGQKRKVAKVIEYMGVDEKAFRKGQSYVTVVCDIETATVEHVADDRKAESLGAYLGGLTHKQLWGIKAIAMDMWDPYYKAVCGHVPLAEHRIVFDRFHITKHMGDAVDKVRRQEHQEFKAAGGKNAEKLKGARHLFLYAEENVPEEKRSRLRELLRGNLRSGRAWAWKESLRDLWSYSTEGWARRFFGDWYAGAIRSRLEPVKKVARMLKSRLDNIVSYCRYPITNGVAEGLNSKIMTIKRKACGFANREHFKMAIYFHCGGLSLYPEPSPGAHRTLPAGEPGALGAGDEAPNLVKNHPWKSQEDLFSNKHLWPVF